jgi:hypothetical protein
MVLLSFCFTLATYNHNAELKSNKYGLLVLGRVKCDNNYLYNITWNVINRRVPVTFVPPERALQKLSLNLH